MKSYCVQEQADRKFVISFLLTSTTYSPSLHGLNVEEYFRKLTGKIYTDVLFGYEMNFSCVSFKVTNIGLEPKSYIYNFQALIPCRLRFEDLIQNLSMAIISRLIEIGWAPNMRVIKYDLEIVGDKIIFTGNAYLPELIKFTYELHGDNEPTFVSSNTNNLKTDLIIDAIMTDYEKYRISVQSHS